MFLFLGQFVIYSWEKRERVGMEREKIIFQSVYIYCVPKRGEGKEGVGGFN